MSVVEKSCCRSTGSFVHKSSVFSCDNEVAYFVVKEVLMKLIDSELAATSPAASDVAVSALLEIIIAVETMNVMYILLLWFYFRCDTAGH